MSGTFHFSVTMPHCPVTETADVFIALMKSVSDVFSHGVIYFSAVVATKSTLLSRQFAQRNILKGTNGCKHSCLVKSNA